VRLPLKPPGGDTTYPVPPIEAAPE